MKRFEDLRIVFLGTPDFAVASLKALVNAGANVVAVVTAPDKPAGRGMQMQQSAIKQYAVSQNLPVLQPEKLKNPEFIEELRSYHADIQIVVAFRMLPEMVWDMPPLGTVNVHASLLPQYRGAAPISWAIINGEKKTGVTTFRLKHQIDTGNILLQHELPIEPEDNIGTLYEKLMHAGADLLIKTVKGLADDTITEMPQDALPENLLKHAPKIFKEHTEIDWNRKGIEIQNLIRGLSPHPAAYALLNDKQVKIYGVHTEEVLTENPIGSFDTDGKTYLRFVCGDGFVYLDDLQLQGKKRIPVVEFLRGFRG